MLLPHSYSAHVKSLESRYVTPNHSRGYSSFTLDIVWEITWLVAIGCALHLVSAMSIGVYTPKLVSRSIQEGKWGSGKIVFVRGAVRGHLRLIKTVDVTISVKETVKTRFNLATCIPSELFVRVRQLQNVFRESTKVGCLCTVWGAKPRLFGNGFAVFVRFVRSFEEQCSVLDLGN